MIIFVIMRCIRLCDVLLLYEIVQLLRPSFGYSSETKIRAPSETTQSTCRGHRLEVQLQLVILQFQFADTEQKVDISRRDSISASELRRLARKQARKGVSKVLPIAEPLCEDIFRFTQFV